MEPVDLEKRIGELEIAVDRLRSLYEQYFVGLEKIEPGVLRKDVDRRVYALRKEQIRNTALRFRFQTVLQRYNTYQTHWQRICREIENGTYKRHLLRAQRRFGSTRPPGPPAVSAAGADSLGVVGSPPGVPADLVVQMVPLDRDLGSVSFDIDIEMDDPPVAEPVPSTRAVSRVPPPERPQLPPARAAAPAVWKKVPHPAGGSAPQVAPAATAPPAVPAPPTHAPVRSTAPAASTAAAPPRPTPPRPTQPIKPAVVAAPGDLPEERLRQIYAEYVGAKRSQNESTAAITYQAVAKSLRESGDRLRKKHGRAVDFEVAVKDGKAILRPILK